MEEQRNKVIGLIGTSECVGKYITTKLSSEYADYFIINTQSMLPDNESVLECMRKWSEQYSQHKFSDDDLLTFLSIAELDDKINETVRSLSVGEQKRLHFLNHGKEVMQTLAVISSPSAAPFNFPIFYKDYYLGAIMCGQVLLDKPYENYNIKTVVTENSKDEIPLFDTGNTVIDRVKTHIIYPDLMSSRIIKSHFFCPVNPGVILWIDIFFQ